MMEACRMFGADVFEIKTAVVTRKQYISSFSYYYLIYRRKYHCLGNGGVNHNFGVKHDE